MPTPALPRTVPRALLLGIGAGAALLAVFVLALLFWDRIVPAARQEIAHDAADQAAQLAEARSAILTGEPDADSVTLGKVAVDWIGQAPAVCGRVDIEEPQDSLDGEERFVFVDGQLTLESRDGSAAVDAKWRDVCDDV
ncbi:hypothetical protein [Phenylobacterium sp.]|uniref:hypothetical protein n=1 Tax=Phenylobacterium sp. TaxID=1871053 RepID=UPI0025D82867|nr:hypothetical protein [Phenylobacterium sp.]